MELTAIVEVLRKAWLLIVACVLTGAVVGSIPNFTQAPQYDSTATVFFSVAKGTTGGDLAQGTAYAQNVVQSYVLVAKLPVVLDPVIEDLGLDISAAQLAPRITAETPVDTVLVDLTVRWGSAERSAEIANAVAAQLLETATRLAPRDTTSTTSSPSITGEVVAPATVRSVPSTPNKQRNLAMGLIAGLVAGLALALLRSSLDNKIRDESQAALVTTVPVLGAISNQARASREPIIGTAPGSRMEDYRRLGLNLRAFDPDHRMRTLLVTSSLAGEGKSTTSANLACMLAQDNERVILVDADLRRPSVARHLGLEGAVGLATVLGKEVQVSEAVQRWDAGGIDVLCSGMLPPNPSALLGSEAMVALLAELRAEYDWVVLDGVPLLAVNDAATLSRLCDGTLLVVNSRKVHRRQLARALRSLELVGSSVIGLVLNRTTRERGTSYYSSFEDLGGHRRWWQRALPQRTQRHRHAARAHDRHEAGAKVRHPAGPDERAHGRPSEQTPSVHGLPRGATGAHDEHDGYGAIGTDLNGSEDFGGWLPPNRPHAADELASGDDAPRRTPRATTGREWSNARRS